MLALVDDEDYQRVVSLGKWTAHHIKGNWYALTTTRENGIKRNLYMHKLIATFPGMVDHKNRNGLDNQKENLRPASASQNTANSKIPSNNTSGFKGVFYDPRKERWSARICVRGVRRRLGSYRTPEEAALAYDIAAKDGFGEYANPNFPN